MKTIARPPFPLPHLAVAVLLLVACPRAMGVEPFGSPLPAGSKQRLPGPDPGSSRAPAVDPARLRPAASRGVTFGNHPLARRGRPARLDQGEGQEEPSDAGDGTARPATHIASETEPPEEQSAGEKSSGEQSAGEPAGDEEAPSDPSDGAAGDEPAGAASRADDQASKLRLRGPALDMSAAGRKAIARAAGEESPVGSEPDQSASRDRQRSQKGSIPAADPSGSRRGEESATGDPAELASARLANHSADGPAAADDLSADDSPSDDREALDESASSEKPWLPLVAALLGLFASLGTNVYLLWLAAGQRRHYRRLLSRPTSDNEPLSTQTGDPWEPDWARLGSPEDS